MCCEYKLLKVNFGAIIEIDETLIQIKLNTLMQTKILSTLTLMMLFSIATQAQDYIHKKNREILIVKLVEIGTDEIKFKDFDNPDGPLFSIEKEKVSKIELENGDEMIMKSTNSFDDPDYYTGQNKNNIKWSFSGLMFNHLTFIYERSLTPSTSFEGGLSIIGAGYSPNGENLGEYNLRNPTGVGFRAGYKLKRSPDVYLSKMRYGHILKGAYFKPEIIVSIFNEDVPSYAKPPSQTGYDIARRNAASGALMMNLGKQWIFSDQFSLDIYFGIGYGFSSSENYKWDDENYRDSPATLMYGFLLLPEIPLAFSGGLNIGYVFGK